MNVSAYCMGNIECTHVVVGTGVFSISTANLDVYVLQVNIYCASPRAVEVPR